MYLDRVILSPGGVIETANGTDIVTANAAGTGANVLASIFPKITVTAMTTSATITTAAILGGQITANQGAAGAATYTMPTGTVLQAALPSTFVVGDAVEFVITNISTNAAEDVTVAGATGTTMKGNVTVASNDAVTTVSWGKFRAVKTGTNTFDVYRVG